MNHDGLRTAHSAPEDWRNWCTWPMAGPPAGRIEALSRTNRRTPSSRATSMNWIIKEAGSDTPIGAMRYAASTSRMAYSQVTGFDQSNVTSPTPEEDRDEA